MAAPVGPKKVHRYTLEFKIQAVRLANHPEIQTQDVAYALDIHPFMLSKWKKDYREGRLKPAAEAAGLSLPKVLRAPKGDPEKQTLRRQVNRRSLGLAEAHTLQEDSCLTTSNSESATMPRAKRSSSRHSNRSA